MFLFGFLGVFSEQQTKFSICIDRYSFIDAFYQYQCFNTPDILK